MSFSIIEIPAPSKPLATTEKSRPYFAPIQIWYLFLAIYLGYAALSWLTNLTFLTKDVYYNTFSEQISFQQIETFINLQRRYAFLSYVLILPSLLLKIMYNAIWLCVAAVLTDWDFSFGDMFKITIVAEIVFLAGAVTHFIWCLLFLDVRVLSDVVGFYPLSVLNFFNIAEIEPWLIYPLRTLNLFEVAYCVFLTFLLMDRYKRSSKAAAGLAVGAYSVGLLLWIVLVMFLNVQLS
jgi:hypothetical protein